VQAVASEPVSALEHYEKAVEREVAGKLGDSLSLYRKAFRVGLSVSVLLLMCVLLTVGLDG
jgi:F-box protein 9